MLSLRSRSVVVAARSADVEAQLRESDASCVIVDTAWPDAGADWLWHALDAAVRSRPMQIVAIAFENGRWRDGLARRVDDIIRSPDELSYRLELVAARQRRLEAIWSEAEFYRRAVREEELVASQIVEHTLHLRQAYRTAEETNLELARKHRELERVSRLDSLSGLLNRSSLFAMVDAELERAERSGSPLCGVMMDIDRFKSINDTYGHGCGDAVLRAVGGLLQRELRKYDQAGRYGGEEFFVLLPNTEVASAAAFAERVRLRLCELAIEAGEFTLRVSASFGVACYSPGESRDRWVSRADRGMYRSKQAGRNRVEIAAD